MSLAEIVATIDETTSRYTTLASAVYESLPPSQGDNQPPAELLQSPTSAGDRGKLLQPACGYDELQLWRPDRVADWAEVYILHADVKNLVSECNTALGDAEKLVVADDSFFRFARVFYGRGPNPSVGFYEGWRAMYGDRSPLIVDTVWKEIDARVKAEIDGKIPPRGEREMERQRLWAQHEILNGCCDPYKFYEKVREEGKLDDEKYQRMFITAFLGARPPVGEGLGRSFDDLVATLGAVGGAAEMGEDLSHALDKMSRFFRGLLGTRNTVDVKVKQVRDRTQGIQELLLKQRNFVEAYFIY